MNEIGGRILERLAEISPGTSQNELARRVEMDPSAMSRVLNGKRGLAGAELVALARELQTSTDWLLLGEEPFPIRLAARHDYRGNGAYALDQAEGVTATVQGIATAYEQAAELESFPVPSEVPRDPAEARRMLQEQCGDQWQRHFADAVERTFGLDVVKMSLPTSSGLSLRLPNATVIVVPTEAFWARQNWTIAHELEHIAVGDFSEDGNVGHSGENAANRYAAELLMPVDAVRAIEWSNLDESSLAEYLWNAGVSIEALVNRLNFLRIPAPSTRMTTLRLAKKHVAGKNAFDDPVALRLQDAASRRFPTRLVAAHEANPRSRSTLEWILGAPFESGSREDAEREPAVELPSIGDLKAAFGMRED